jgi:hypothetical protein
LSSATSQDGVRIEQVKASAPEELKRQETGSSSNAVETSVNVHLMNFSDNTRVHMFATQFVPNCPNSLFTQLKKHVSEEISQTIFKFAAWKNMF